ncbi:MAG: hypothetical protein MUF51_01930 [Vicinamibacteria bacterium]|nr:hypothetical protein [Vicinamibacteria bacterium]
MTPLSASQPTPVPARMMSVTAVRAPAVERTTFNGVLQAEVEAARAAYAARNATVGLQAGNGIAPPGCPLDLAKQAVSALLSAGATACASGAAILRCERKPVLLRSSSGEVRRDFIMVALAHNGDIDAAQQQRVIKGGDTGPFGLAQQLTKKIGGFLRFAPLPGGGMETRLFLPV